MTGAPASLRNSLKNPLSGPDVDHDVHVRDYVGGQNLVPQEQLAMEPPSS
jgi:hypothetical protein